jgi:ribosomal protein S18 acetylase RimI-like enzyme
VSSLQHQRGEIEVTFSIRSATRQDLTQFASITSKDENWVRALTAQLQNSNTRILVAEQDDQLVGFIYFLVVNRGVDEVKGHIKRFINRYLGINGNEFNAIVQPFKFGLIQEIYVKPELRNHGIARALIEFCIEWSKSQQIRELQVEIHPDEEALGNLFRKLGFVDSRVTLQRNLPKRVPKYKGYIRFAVLDDLPQLADLVKKQIMYQESLANSFKLRSEIDWSRYVLSIMKNRAAVLLVAEQNEQLVGYFEAWVYMRGVYGIRSKIRAIVRSYIYPTIKQPELFGVMEHVFVLPEFRKGDVAQNLVLGAVNWFQEKGVQKVLGSVWINNESTLKITRVIGFKVIKIILSKRI